MFHQAARRQSRADHVGGENLGGGRDDLCALFERATCKRNIIGDDDITLPCPLRDPVIGDVGPGIDQHEADARIHRRADEGVGHDKNVPADAAGDLVDFVLHRAGVSIDVDRWHGRDLNGMMAEVQTRLAAAVAPCR